MPRPIAVTRAVPAATGPRRVATPVQANVPKARPRGRSMFGWDVIVLPSMQAPDTVEIDPDDQTLTMRPDTYAWVRNDTAAVQFLAHEKAEAVRTMQVRMADVSKYAATRPPNPNKTPPPSPGIKLLCHELQALVTDLARLDPTNPTAVTDAAGRYGRLRDTMADLRTAFNDAEASFELAQNLLIEKMGIE